MRGADRLAGFGLDPARPVADVTVEVADRVQQHLVGYEFLPWPACTDGRHVRQPATVAGEAVWRCAGHLVRIGELGSGG